MAFPAGLLRAGPAAVRPRRPALRVAAIGRRPAARRCGGCGDGRCLDRGRRGSAHPSRRSCRGGCDAGVCVCSPGSQVVCTGVVRHCHRALAARPPSSVLPVLCVFCCPACRPAPSGTGMFPRPRHAIRHRRPSLGAGWFGRDRIVPAPLGPVQAAGSGGGAAVAVSRARLVFSLVVSGRASAETPLLCNCAFWAVGDQPSATERALGPTSLCQLADIGRAGPPIRRSG